LGIIEQKIVVDAKAIYSYDFSQRVTAAVRESGAKPERPRHCNRDETAKPLGDIPPGRRGSRMNGSQETGLRLRRLTCLRGRVWPVNQEGGPRRPLFPFPVCRAPARSGGLFRLAPTRFSAADASQAAPFEGLRHGTRTALPRRPRIFSATNDVSAFPPPETKTIPISPGPGAGLALSCRWSLSLFDFKNKQKGGELFIKKDPSERCDRKRNGEGRGLSPDRGGAL